MKCNILTGSPGSRKTWTMLKRMLSTPSRYIVTLPRNALIDEKACDLALRAHKTGVAVTIVPIHSDQPRQREKNVKRRVEDALKAHAAADHVIVLVSHETFLALDVSLLQGWHTGIDENLDGAVMSGSFSATQSWSMLDRHYGLDPLRSGQVSEVRLRPDVGAPKRGEYTKDAAQDLVAFHKCCTNPNRLVFVDLSDWKDAQNVSRKVRWWSIWTPMMLEGCASVTIAAAGYFDSLPYYAARWLYGESISFVEENVGAGVVRANPRVRVHFFTEGHVGSTDWWDTDDGNACPVAVSRYMEKIGGVGYYSCNNAIRDVFRNRFVGQRCDPKLAGTNELIHHTSCLYIYSNKAQDSDAPILDLLGLDRNVIRRTREFEDVRQFIMRGVIRRPEYDGDYDIYVYDRAQAEDLAAYLKDQGISDRVELVPVHEAGIMDVKRLRATSRGPSSGRPVMTAAALREKEAERKRQDRAKDKAEAIANGTYRPPGAPPKAARVGADHRPV